MAQASMATPGQIQRLLDKRDFKQALKDARVANRQAPSDDSRRLLQRCAIARADELQRNGLAVESQNIVDELCQLRPLPQELQQSVSDLLVRMGLYEQYAEKLGLSAGEMTAERLGAIADVAVQTGRTGTASLVEGSNVIRRCLDSLQAGQVESATQLLESIPRSSPFADWKLFARGLMAYYRGDDAGMTANWDRLDPNRKSTKIASRLRCLSAVASGSPRSEASDKAISLIDQHSQSGVLSHLENVQQILHDGDHRRAADALRPCLAILGQLAPKLKGRVLEVATQKAIRSGSYDLMEQLTGSTVGPPFDPKWNRAWALFYEADFETGFELLEEHWVKYIACISQVQIWSDEERRLAEALVLCHLAKLYAIQSRSDDDDDFEFDPDGYNVADMQQRDRQKLIGSLTKAQLVAPELPEVWKAEVEAAIIREDRDAEIVARQKLLERFPEDLDSLVEAGELLLRSDRCIEALPLLERAFRLKPLDEMRRIRVIYAHYGSARLLAIEKRFDDARSHLMTAEQLDSTGTMKVDLLARRSILERKAGNDDLALALDREACALRDEPTSILLELLIQSVRFKLPKAVAKHYEADWKTWLSKKCSAQAAGEMSGLMVIHLASDTRYDGFERHAAMVADYVSRATRVSFERTHLRNVCEFLSHAASDLDLKRNLADDLKKLATRAKNQFPDDPCFLKYLSDAEYLRGPARAHKARMKSWLKQALKLAELKPELAPPNLVNEIREQLETVERSEEASSFGSPFGVPFGFPGFGSSAKQSEHSSPFDGIPLPPDLLEVFQDAMEDSGMTPEELIEEVLGHTKPKGRGRKKR